MTNNQLSLSVVTAVFNRSRTIFHSMHSLHTQKYGRVEHIIQDGGSTDGTLDLIRSWRDASTRLYSEPDNGIYDALNRGIAKATGDVIGLLHSDDFFAHDCVLALIADAFADPTTDGVYGDLQYVAADDPSRVVRHWRSGPYHPEKLRRGWMPPHPTLFLRRSVFDCWGLYDTNLRIAADYDAMLRYLVKGNIRLIYIPEVLVRMRVGGASNGSLSRLVRKSCEDLVAIRRNGIGGIGTLAMKNISKIGQFVSRDGFGPA